MRYIIVVNQPGSLPISLEIDEAGESGHEAEQVLMAIQDTLEGIAPYDDSADGGKWNLLFRNIANDLDNAADFDPRGGFLYQLPDGYAIEAMFMGNG